jgi:hypothetical protein
LRSRLKAELIFDRLQGGDGGDLLMHDPELREIARLSSLLETVAAAEPLPSPDARRRMKERVMESHRLTAEGVKVKEGDPARRVTVLETQRLSYATLAAAAVLAAILVVSSVFFTGPGRIAVPPSMGLASAEAWVFGTGEVEVLPSGGEWTQRETPLVVTEGDSVRTPSGVRAEVAFGGENLLRLDYESEAGISKVGDGTIAVALRSGEGYFRAQDGTSFQVSGEGVEARTLGTVFDVDFGGEKPEILALLDDLDVNYLVQGGARSRLDEGKMLDLPGELGPDGLTPYIRDIPPERLQEEWLLWNGEIDESRGWDLGVMSSVEPQAVQIPEISLMGQSGEQPDEGGNKDDEGENKAPSIDLQGALQGQRVELSWALKDGTASGFIILRGEGAEPSYPQDILARLNPDRSSYLDQQTKEGTIYFYRVAIEYNGSIIYSNPASFSIPKTPASIALQGSVIKGELNIPVIELTWHVQGTVDAEYYALVRAEMRQTPTWPATGSMISVRFTPGMSDYSHIDRNNLYMGYTYNYRVFAVKGGRIVLESNTVSVYVDTASIK